MSERETRDLMSVDAFSQLPFIRSAPAREKNPTTAIRLFGIEFPHDIEHHDDTSSSSSSSKDNNSNNGGAAATENCHSNGNASGGNGAAGGGGGEDGSRRFECHYCCRNFPTSQALGGHQNAHKRERQQAKRAHLQSAMAAHHYHHGIAAADGHVYGLLNYHRLGSIPSSSSRFGIGHDFEALSTSHYPSWSSPTMSTATGAGTSYSIPRFYSGPGSVSQPINGSPVSGLWRSTPAVQAGGGSELLPAVHREHSMALPLLGDDSRLLGGGGGGTGYSSSSSSLPPQNRLLFESAKAGVKDHLSLDLHL